MGFVPGAITLKWTDFALIYGYKNMPFATMNVIWFWYLVLDFQCFLAVPIILMLSWISKWIGIAICIILITVSCIYTMIVSFQYDMIFDLRNMSFNNDYYYLWITRCCVYYIGSLAALLTMKPDQKKGEPSKADSKETKTNRSTKQITNLKYEIVPEKPKNSIENLKISKSKRKSQACMIGTISFIIVVTSFILCRFWFQAGYNLHNYSKLVNALWITFGKILFVPASMMLLIKICQTFKSIPSAVANNATIQFIGNISFSIYGWHYCVLMLSISSNETFGFYADYYFYGCFFWVFTVASLPSLWTALTIEFPLGDLWRLIEVPFVKNFK